MDSSIDIQIFWKFPKCNSEITINLETLKTLELCDNIEFIRILT